MECWTCWESGRHVAAATPSYLLPKKLCSMLSQHGTGCVCVCVSTILLCCWYSMYIHVYTLYQCFPCSVSARLTVGARALSKHCHRDDSVGWWGQCSGSKGNPTNCIYMCVHINTQCTCMWTLPRLNSSLTSFGCS